MFQQHQEYVLSNDLNEALLVAEVTQRPLLIKGEPGTGKTLLAEYVAQKKGIPLFRWHVKSSTLAKDGLYFYDAITRLNDSRFNDGKKDVGNINNYIRLEAMGQAFKYDGPCVLLIDEIDKADIEFPNDLLLELDRMEFVINETGEVVKAKQRPFVIITSNNEKELPDAFLRRCIFHFIDFPDREMMKKIVLSHFEGIGDKLIEQAMDIFYQVRSTPDLKKKPSTSELVDWVNILLHQGANPQKGTAVNFLGTLLKNEDDFFRFKK